MIRRILFGILCVILLAGCTTGTDNSLSGGYTFTDDTGARVTVPYKPERVAVLTSSLSDLWLTAGGQVDITVGESLERGFVDQTAVLVDEGAGKTINLECLIREKPDFVIYSAELSGQLECVQSLKQAGIPAAGFSVETLDDYLQVLKICTDILETPHAYVRYGTEVEQRVGDLITRAKAQPAQPKILFVRAGSSAKYTKAKTAENHFVCVMLKELGTHNIAEQATILLDGLSMEEILLSDPDVILFTTMGEESAGVTYMESLLADPIWQAVAAVKTGNIYQLPKDLFQYKPNARWDEAYAYLISLLYGEIL